MPSAALAYEYDVEPSGVRIELVKRCNRVSYRIGQPASATAPPPHRQESSESNQRDNLLKALRPGKQNVRVLLLDLQRFTGFKYLATALEVRENQLHAWLKGSEMPARHAAKLIWLLWALICRPGQVKTVFDLATYGRFTPLGGPEWAGSPPLRATKRKIRGK